jgi:HAE1 family hydrophobic/amphiphilic exporter-1
MRKVCFLTLPIMAACFGQAVPQATPTTKPVRVIVLPRRIGILTEAQITLEDVVMSVLANNHDIDSSRIDRMEASIRLSGARGVYEPRFLMEPAFLHSETPVSSSLGGGSTPGKLRQTNISATPQVTGSLPVTGATYTVSYSSARNSTDNLFATLNPQFPTTLTFSAVQPLFRGLKYDDNRRQIQIAKKNQNLTDEQFRQKVIETASQAVAAYWDLVYAVRNLQVQVDSVDLARKQVESNQRQVEQGILAPIDIVEAETQLDTFEQNVYTAQQALTRAENVLKNLMLRERQSALWSAALIPATPLELDPPEVEFQAAVKEALEMRPEVAQSNLSADLNQINTRFFQEQTKPQADLVVSYSSSGLAGKALTGPSPFSASSLASTALLNQLAILQGLQPLPPAPASGSPSFLVGSYAQSLGNLTAWNYPTANASIRINIPLRNRTAEANLAVSEAEARRIATQRAQLEMRIESDVRDTMQAMQSSKVKLGAAVLARQSSEEQYQSELRKFQEGTSTVFLVLQRQTAMIEARNAELRSQTDLSKAIADFERATTRVLAKRSISLQ